jgi:D-amino peptidase
MKLFISADIEGVAGTVSREQMGPKGFEYERAREWMTGEVNAAIESARQSGVTEVIVADSHGNGQNLLLDKFPDVVKVVRSWPRPLMMMQGVDEENISAALLIGYHSGVTFPSGNLAHTLSGSTVSELRLNKKAVSEAAISAATAGHFGVPVIMVSGDDGFVEETRSLLGDVEAAITKWSSGWTSTKTLTPEASRARIRESVKAAFGRLGDFKPFRFEEPIELEVDLKNRITAELLDYLTIVERTGASTIRYVGKDIVDVVKFLVFALEYQPVPQK